jgi:hypothetical protein
MALPRLTSPDAVTRTLDEFDELGRDAFRSKYGYGRAKRYFVERDGRLYDSKAIFGVALGYEYPTRGFVRNNEFSGGEGSAVRSLRRLGFTIKDTRLVQQDLTEVVLPQNEVDRFAVTLSSDAYLEDERDYKLAVHEVVSRLFSVETMERGDFPQLLASFFERKMDLADIGIEGELAESVTAATARLYGVTNAFVNLAGGGFGVNNFIWIPEAVRIGFGDEIKTAFATLVDGNLELADRVEGFRDGLYAVEEQAQATGVFKPEWKLIRISLAFTAALLGAFDPSQFTFYHQGKLRKSYEEFVGPWPNQNGGALYETLCEFVESVAGALERQGAPIEDLIDAQSFLYLRAAEQPSEVDTVGTLHLVAKWSAQHGADTVKLHQVVAEEHGEVWWGVIGTGERKKLSDQNIGSLRAQLEQGIETHVFVAGPATEQAFRTRLVDVSVERPADEALIPSYYSSAERHSLWLKLADFESIERVKLLQELEPAAEPGGLIALGNQTNPLLVRVRATPRVWWVNQGDSYRRAREGGYLWAPQTNKVGRAERHHEALRYARAGDVVVNYANGQIRAVSAVSRDAVAATRPEPDADQAWANDGWRLDVAYHDLTTPLPLAAIPEGERRKAGSPFDKNGEPIQGYMFVLSDALVNTLRSVSSELAALLPKGDETVRISVGEAYAEPSFEEIKASILGQGLALTDRTIRRYHLSVKSRGFVVLSGVSGTGKTWLAQAYAQAVGAAHCVVPVAPNWTTNEDLLGFRSPLGGSYQDTPFSSFLREASREWTASIRENRAARPYHVILDEMNLAKVEYYFAAFLSSMELRARDGETQIPLAPNDAVTLGPNLRFVGTVNIDETTHLFSDKVFDRAQLVELSVDREELARHIGDTAWAPTLLDLWDLLAEVAPFAFRIADEIGVYIAHAETIGVSWQEALDEQIFQKLLPKLKGGDSRLGPALEQLMELTATDFPLSHEKARAMNESYEQHGFSSYF